MKEDNGPLRVDINISGKLFETREATLKKFPKTLLGNIKKRTKYYCHYRNEYYFNRNRESFESILYFYQSSGMLYRPLNIELEEFIEECEFFQLPSWAIKMIKRKEGGELQDYIHTILNPTFHHSMNLRKRMWAFLEYPKSSPYARGFAFFYIGLVFISIFTNCLKTVKELRTLLSDSGYDPWEIIELILNVFFTVEFLVRLVISPEKIRFFKSLSTWFDIMALIPSILMLLKYQDKYGAGFTRWFQMFRLLRLFRIAKASRGFKVTTVILKDSFEDLQLFVSCLFVYVIFGATIIYHLENMSEPTQFTSIPESIWWAIQTCVTLGYGDIVPKTEVGKIFAAMFMFFVIPTLSIPVMSVIMKFTKYFSFNKVASEN